MPSFVDKMLEYVTGEDLPNSFSVYMGKRIREAREEKGWSQQELADMIYKRRASISEIENGKMYPDVVSLTLIAANLQKPLRYFIIAEDTYPRISTTSPVRRKN